MASIAEIVTRYQAAQKSYERAVARAGGSVDAPWTGKSIGIAGRAVAAAGEAPRDRLQGRYLCCGSR